MSAAPGGAPAGGARRASLGERVPPLGTAGFDEILDRFLAWVGERGLELYPAQEEAILELMAGKHVVLGTPTGSGKSLVAEALHFKALCEGQRSCYTSPIKALASEKFFALCEDFGASNVGMMTGDASINRDAPIICCTAEVLSNLALRQSTDLAFPYVVIDEFHYYADRDRGVAWQVPLLTLPNSTFLLMSATLGDTTAIEQSITRLTRRDVARVVSDQRPVPLDFEYREELLHETVESLLEAERAPVYVVSFTQRECAERAQALTSAKVCTKEQKRAIGEVLQGFKFDSPYGTDVRRFVTAGIGIHHAGLLPKYRLLVEQLAQQGLLRVICGTDTLGVGVNIPIRTVLFSQLCKFDGQKTALLSVRDFQQIAGRAGRKGFDDRGWVVALAPEHVVENRRLDLKAAAGKKIVKKKPPTRGFVPWNAETLEKLRTSSPEPLQSRFAVTHGMMLSVLQRDPRDSELPGGYGAVLRLVDRCHESERVKHRLRRDAAVVFRSLKRAGIVELTPRAGGRRGRDVGISDKLQPDFSLHSTLSLYLAEVIAVLDPASPTYALDVLTFVESILENPRPVLERQIDRAKGELVARLKAEGVPYEDRMRELEDVSYPKPNEELVYATFNAFSEKHPWVRAENIRPKSIAREMVETYVSFEDYVRNLEISRSEGLLLRYLNQAHNTLTQTVPLERKTDAVFEVTAYFRTMLARVDSSLLAEWQNLLEPESVTVATVEAATPIGGAAPPLPAGKALTARLRVELHRLVAALTARNWAEAARCVRPAAPDEEAWDEKRFEAAMAPFYAEHERLFFDHRARLTEFTTIARTGTHSWTVQQTLLDPTDENLWAIHGEVDLAGDVSLDHPLIRVTRIGT
ncbi:MAG: DUF3516 domain-containing protein [Deltaproteobacteria bacterium]|nr:DUF3516 domain-containing protein [Deltaproteobacteria bacterium]